MEVSVGYKGPGVDGSFWTVRRRDPVSVPASQTEWRPLEFSMNYKTGSYSPERPWNVGWVKIISSEPGRLVIGARAVEFQYAQGVPWYRHGHWCWSDDYSNMRVEVTWPLNVRAITPSQPAPVPSPQFKTTSSYLFTAGPVRLDGMETAIKASNRRRGDIPVPAGSSAATCALKFFAATADAGIPSQMNGFYQVDVHADKGDIFKSQGCAVTVTMK